VSCDQSSSIASRGEIGLKRFDPDQHLIEPAVASPIPFPLRTDRDLKFSSIARNVSKSSE
jgi:hypothetical protein